MGREYSKLSDDQKRKWFGEDRNRRRREKYAQDKAYRDKVLQQTKSSRKKAMSSNATSYDLGTASAFVHKYAKRHLVYCALTEQVSVVDHVLPKSLLITLLGVSAMTFSRWVDTKLLPQAVFYAKGMHTLKDQRRAFYSRSECLLILKYYYEESKQSSKALKLTSAKLFAETDKIHQTIIKESFQ